MHGAASLSFPLSLQDHYSRLADSLHYHSAKDQFGHERDSTWREGDRTGLLLVV